MGAGASGLEAEAALPLDGSDLDGVDYLGVRGELSRVRTLLNKFNNEPVSLDASDLCVHASDEENREACLNELVYMREMIRLTSATGGRRMRRKASLLAMKLREEDEAAAAAAAAEGGSEEGEGASDSGSDYGNDGVVGEEGVDEMFADLNVGDNVGKGSKLRGGREAGPENDSDEGGQGEDGGEEEVGGGEDGEGENGGLDYGDGPRVVPHAGLAAQMRAAHASEEGGEGGDGGRGGGRGGSSEGDGGGGGASGGAGSSGGGEVALGVDQRMAKK